MTDGKDLVLPAFEMDCREWLVVDPASIGLADEARGEPVLAMLSTVVLTDTLQEATGTLGVALLDDEELEVRGLGPGSAALELFLDDDGEPGARRYLMPSPGGQQLALLAEFTISGDDPELGRRVDRLMASFRWQAG